MESISTSMQGKVCLITGATNGIGLIGARELARRGARVVLVGRSLARCEAAVAQIQAQTGNPRVEALVADLSSQRQIRSLGQQIRERCPRLNVLVNNAGGLWLTRETTEDGLEKTVAVNHLAYFLLAHLLVDLLRISSPARVVNVSSRAHEDAVLDWEDPMATENYHGWRQYCRSKLMNLLFTYELARRLEGAGVTANALHPGWVATGFAANNGWKGLLWQVAARCLAITPEQGARTLVYLATSEAVAGVNGRYFVRERLASSSPASMDENAGRRLWHLSEQWVGLDPSVVWTPRKEVE